LWLEKVTKKSCEYSNTYCQDELSYTFDLVTNQVHTDALKQCNKAIAQFSLS